MFIHDHVQVTLLITVVLRSAERSILTEWTIDHMAAILDQTKILLACMKVLSEVITVPNINEIHPFISENRPWTGMVSI